MTTAPNAPWTSVCLSWSMSALNVLVGPLCLLLSPIVSEKSACKIMGQIETKETYLIPSFSTLCKQQNRMPLRQGWTSSWASQFYGGESSKFHGKRALPTHGKCLLEPGISSSLGYAVLRGNWAVVLLLISQAGSSSHNDLSLLSKAPLSNLRPLLCALSLDLATASWTEIILACSPFVSQHNGFHDGLPSSYGQFETLFSPLIISVQDLIPHLHNIWAPSTLLSTLQWRSLAHARQPSQGEGSISGRGRCFGAVYVCTGSCSHPLDLWAPEGKVWGLETSVTLKFMSSWDMSLLCSREKEVWGNAVNPTSGCRSQFSS